MSRSSKDGSISRRSLLKLGGLGVLASMAPGLWENDTVQVRRHTLLLPKWDADGFRVAQVSDIHANSPGAAARASQAIRLAIAERPDVLLITGDFVNRDDAHNTENLRDALMPLHDAKCPVYGIWGNHDSDTNPRYLHAGMDGAAIRMLCNEAAEIQGVTLAGIDDALFNRQDLRFLTEREHSKSLLAMWHEPDFVVETPKCVSLQLSGHSHGGEVCLPGGIPIHTPIGARRYIAGFYPDAWVPLYVSKGVATLGPCRVYCPPEIIVYTLKGSVGAPPTELPGLKA
ncbi:MAG TPA: metallophosphoesterase [Fimbriimonas sp.]|nr:metallophosphoesterase [Fimbriimonas sp.]